MGREWVESAGNYLDKETTSVELRRRKLLGGESISTSFFPIRKRTPNVEHTFLMGNLGLRRTALANEAPHLRASDWNKWLIVFNRRATENK